MRTASVSALAFLLSLICLPGPATPQTNMAAPNHLSLLPRPASPAAASSLSKNQSPSDTNATIAGAVAGNQASIFRQLKDRASKENPFGDGQWRNSRPETSRLEPAPGFSTPRSAPPAQDVCAHILIRQFRSADSKMVLERPGGISDNMSVAAGLPACHEDVR